MLRPQFTLRALLVAMLVVAAFCAFIPTIYELLFPTPRVLSDTIMVEQGIRWHHLVWSNGAQVRVPPDAGPIEARNGSGRWRAPAPAPSAARGRN